MGEGDVGEGERVLREGREVLRRAAEVDGEFGGRVEVVGMLNKLAAMVAQFEAVAGRSRPLGMELFERRWREERVVAYADRGLREAVKNAVFAGWAPGDLSTTPLHSLHLLPRTAKLAPLCPQVLAAFRVAGTAVPEVWGRKMAPGKRGRQGVIKAFRRSRE